MSKGKKSLVNIYKQANLSKHRWNTIKEVVSDVAPVSLQISGFTAPSYQFHR